MITRTKILLSLTALLVSQQSIVLPLFAADAVAPAATDSKVEAADASATTVGAETASTAAPSKPRKSKWQPGQELEIKANTQDLVPTDDVALAQKQVEAYPDSPEAAFLLAVALTRTSHVEDALKAVRRARKLAEAKGGSEYFDKMIATYEDMLKTYPEENRVRYSLAWAYYMKAYLLANYSRKVAKWKAINGDPQEAIKNGTAAKQLAEMAAATAASAKSNQEKTGNDTAPKTVDSALAGLSKQVDLGKMAQALTAVAGGTNPPADAIPKVPSIMDNTDPSDAAAIRKNFELGLNKLDDLIAKKPDDVWALVYRAHLKAEYTGDLDEAMKTWTACRDRFPNNPAAYFFLGEGYLKQGNLKESVNNVSRAVALRGMGF